MGSNKDKESRKSHYKELNDHMPLKDKIIWAEKKIEEFLKWCSENNYDEITISFSGGKDSTVLLDLVDKIHRRIKSKVYLVPAYAIEITFPSTLKFIKDIVGKYRENNPYMKEPLLKSPILPWKNILEDKGYPIFSKQVSVIINRIKTAKTKNGLSKWIFGIETSAFYKLSKKRLFLLDDKMLIYPDPPKEYEDYFPKNLSKKYTFSEKCCTYVKGGLKNDKRPTFIGIMADESLLRKKSWLDNGCNVFDWKKPTSRPLSIWNSKNIWEYIKKYKLEINEAYNFDHNLEIDEQKLRFERLGCTSCPYGSSIEQLRINSLKRNNKMDNEFKLMNRYEKLYHYSPVLYKSQIINTGIFRAIIDMGIEIDVDKAYKALFDIRQKQIKDWYKDDNFRENLLRVIAQVENHDNYKGFKNKYKDWEYTIPEINKALKHFGVEKEVNEKEMEKIRDKIKKDWNNNK